MAVAKTKPTSAGRRFVVKVVDAELHKVRLQSAAASKTAPVRNMQAV